MVKSLHAKGVDVPGMTARWCGRDMAMRVELMFGSEVHKDRAYSSIRKEAAKLGWNANKGWAYADRVSARTTKVRAEEKREAVDRGERAQSEEKESDDAPEFIEVPAHEHKQQLNVDKWNEILQKWRDKERRRKQKRANRERKKSKNREASTASKKRVFVEEPAARKAFSASPRAPPGPPVS